MRICKGGTEIGQNNLLITFHVMYLQCTGCKYYCARVFLLRVFLSFFLNFSIIVVFMLLWSDVCVVISVSGQLSQGNRV